MKSKLIGVRLIACIWISFFLCDILNCISYREKIRPSAAIIDIGKAHANCNFSINASVPPNDSKVIWRALKDFQIRTQGSEAETQIEIQSIKENKGASGLDFLTAFSLGLIPALRFDEAEYLIKIRQDTKMTIKSVRYEIVSDMIAWFPLLPFAYWPQNNDDRLVRKLGSIFSDYCTHMEAIEQ